MNDLKLKSIQRWENEGGALLPRDCNVHFWNYRDARPKIRYMDSDRKSRRDVTGVPVFHGKRGASQLTFDKSETEGGEIYDNEC